MKKIILLALLVTTTLISGCAAGYHDMTYSRNKDVSWKDAEGIHPGMTLASVLKIMGKPREYHVINGTPYLVYRIETLYGGDVAGAILLPGVAGGGAKVWQHPEGYIIKIGIKNDTVSNVAWQRFKPKVVDVQKAFSTPAKVG